jgi:hypothetical protein
MSHRLGIASWEEGGRGDASLHPSQRKGRFLRIS